MSWVKKNRKINNWEGTIIRDSRVITTMSFSDLMILKYSKYNPEGDISIKTSKFHVNCNPVNQ